MVRAAKRFRRVVGAWLAAWAMVSCPLVAQAGAVLKVERGDGTAFPELRAYVTVVGSSLEPISTFGKENFKVVEKGVKGSDSSDANEVDPFKVQLLEATGYGVAVAVVVQKSGSMLPAMDELRKSTAGFLSGLGEKNQGALVVYSDQAEVLSPMGAASAAAGAATKIDDNLGAQKLLFDGVAQAMTQFAAEKPVARAIVIVGDGGDSGSSADIERLVKESQKRQIPLYAIGHSETGGVELETLKDLVTRATGPYAYVEAQGAADLNKAFNRVKDLLLKQYVVEWKADDINSDKKTYKLEVVLDFKGSTIRSSGEIETPKITFWQKIYPPSPFFRLGIFIVVVLLLLLVIGGIAFAIWWFTPEEVPDVFCAVCKQQMMADWDICLFCLKVAQATLKVTKGPSLGKVYPLVGKTVKIGKGPENAIKLADASVSTNHCGVQVDGTRFEIVDLGSKNGTFVNGKRVPRRFLQNGDVLSLGQTELTFESRVQDDSGPDYGDED